MAINKKPVGGRAPQSTPNNPESPHVQPLGYAGAAPAGQVSLSRTSSVSSHGTWDSGSDYDTQDTLEAESALHQAKLRALSDNRLGLPQSLRPGSTLLESQDIDLIDTQKSWDNLADLQHAPVHQSPPRTGSAPSAELAHLLLEEKQSPSPMDESTSPSTDAATYVPNLSQDDNLLLSGDFSQNQALGQLPAQLDGTAGGGAYVAHPSPQVSLQPPPHSSNPWQEDLDRHDRLKQTSSPPSAPQVRQSSAERVWQSEKQHLTPLPLAPFRPNDRGQAIPQSAISLATSQRNEIYNIKHINWYDGRDTSQPAGKSANRCSPILIQNENGPCPLLALVNASILSTSPGTDTTALQEALQSREQITLGLLLDAVFEELVRKNEQYGRALPDIDDLYAFLITLHTGMNVNPRFVVSEQATETVGVYEASPGTFEQTHMLELYATFGIPLMHGWLMPHGSKEHAAFERTAQTYDDAQNVQFREEELEEKASTQGLDHQEEQIAQDLLTIKQFLATYPSQLTEYGLGLISNWMQAGHFSILFRNDHFAILYKEPRTGSLMALVTDAGYATHEEVVWEALADISGAQSELYSGDFRPVGMTSANKAHTPATTPAPAVALPRVDGENPKTLSATEQEDHDLALALQLQEEENEREQAEATATAARREHEEELSRQFLDQQRPQQPTPDIAPPPRTQHPTVPVIDASARTDDDTAPPPTYEEAASDRPYREGDPTPTPAAGPRLQAPGSRLTQATSHFQTPGSRPNPPPRVASNATGTRGRGRGAGMAPAGRGTRPSHHPQVMYFERTPNHDEKCIVM